METDVDLLNAARKMNKEALVKIFDLYSSALYQYALRLCEDPMLADHIVGDVFVKLIDQLSEGNGPRSNLRSYLYETTYHRMIDETRYAKRRAPLEVVLHQQDTHTPILHLEDQLLFQDILHSLQHELTTDQRHVIVLRFLEEFNLRETAAIMGKTVDHVKVLQNRALAKLRRSMEHKELRRSLPSQTIRNIPNVLGV
ncbi:MAG TPA: sigma-70 family RNA polymerase sigma factor [Anaerolineales bacterium]|jgi:RNA polymerase sigma-70 factor (ECF subfamily)|nr:sigma-70 family RNA polymerase sigma factor [Anaerolineales bacterium]